MRATSYGWQAYRWHTCGSERVGESGFGNINLEQHARRDQVARVSRATIIRQAPPDATGASAMILRQAYFGS